MKTDVTLKRGQFIGKVNSLLQEFHFASKNILLKLVNTYTTSFYGSQLWDPYSAECNKLFRSWNVTVRNVLNLDRATHRYLIEPFSDGLLHPMVMIKSRLVDFYRSQLNSPKFCIRFLIQLAADDLRTCLGRTMHRISVEVGTKIDELSGRLVKSRLKYSSLPDTDTWRVPLGLELMEVRNGQSSLPGFTEEEVELILKHICVY